MKSPINDVSVFTVVVRRGSFTAAAAELGMTRSAVSKRVGRLEARLGVPLLHRTTRSMSVTEAGRQLAAGAAPLLQRLEQLEQDLAARGRELRGRVRLAVPLAFGLQFVLPVLHAFAREHSQVELDVSYSDAHIDLLQGGVDLAIRGGVLPDSTLLARRLRAIHLRWVAAAGYLDRHPAIRRPVDLEGHRLITHFRTPITMTRPDRQVVTLRTSPSMLANNADARADAARAGLGIALLPDFTSTDGLVKVLPDWSPDGQRARAFYLLRPAGADPSRSVTALGDALAAALTR